MGAILAIAGIGSAEISKKLDKALYGEGDEGCNGKKSKSFTKARIKDCKQVSYAQAKLRPQKYPQGAGAYVGSRKLPNCYLPNSCRQDCDYFDRVWKGVKRQITHINKEGLIRRLVGEPCMWKSSGSSCEGVPCSFYRQQATRHYRDFASAEEARWGRILDKFSKSALGKFLSFVPVVGSELDILYKDIKGERPDASDWVSFATDVAFAMVPGGSAVSAGAKAAVKAIAKSGFKQMVKTGALRSTAKTTVRKVFANPLVQQELVQRLGQKARRFYEKYGRHLPGEWVDKAEPYLSAVEGGAAKAEKALGSALQLKKGSRPHSNVPSRGTKNSGGSASRPSQHGHVKNKQQKKRSARYTGVGL